MTNELKIGDELYSIERNRPYNDEKYKIIGETSRSWLVNEIYTDNSLSGWELKVSKKELRHNIPNYGYKQFYTKEGFEEIKYRDKYIDIARKYFDSYSGSKIKTETLRKVIEIIENEK